MSRVSAMIVVCQPWRCVKKTPHTNSGNFSIPRVIRNYYKYMVRVMVMVVSDINVIVPISTTATVEIDNR